MSRKSGNRFSEKAMRKMHETRAHPDSTRSGRALAAMARHIPLMAASLVAIFLVAPIVVIVPMSFSSAISFEFPPPGYWTRYYTQYFTSHSWLEATANSFIIAFASMALTLIAALPAAFGFVRYRF